jgi:hypothetical protein
LERIDLDNYLNEIGVEHSVQRQVQSHPHPTKMTVTHTFDRPQREIDVTIFGDAFPQSVVTSPGLHAELEDTDDGRETKVAATFLLIEGLRMQAEATNRAYAEQGRKLHTQYRRDEQQKADLLTFWDRMGRKVRRTFAAKNPEVAERCEELVREREAKRRADSYDYY